MAPKSQQINSWRFCRRHEAVLILDSLCQTKMYYTYIYLCTSQRQDLDSCLLFTSLFERNQYKYPLQQESFECLPNAVQLRICTININQWKYMGVSKNGGVSPKMDGENNGKPYFNGWFGGKTHYFRKHPFLQSYSTHSFSPESFHESFHVVKQVKAHKAKALNLDKCYVWGFFESLEGLTKIPGNERWMSLLSVLRGLKFKHHPDFCWP